jgi:hypothetical protein
MRSRSSLAAVALALALPLAAPVAAAQEPVEVHTGLYLINFGNFDVTKGTYLMDFYLTFRWRPQAADGEVSPERFEFMNGRPVSKERIFDFTNADGTRELWYRVQANLYTDPDFRSYPFDRQRIVMFLEDAVWPVGNLTYVPAGAELDPGLRVAGYRVERVDLRTEEKAYPFEETHSRVVFEMLVDREVLGTAVKTFLPPVVFMLVSGLGFLFPPDKLGLRVGAGTSMLISAVMFHIAQTAALPPLGTLTLIDKIMMSTYAFLALSLGVTALVSVNTDHWKVEGLTPRINRLGLVATAAAPVVVFGLLWFL